MEQDNTGMIVVLIDTPARMERMHNSYPSLAGKFQYIGCEGSGSAAHRDVADMKTEAERAREEELLRLQAEREAEAARKRLAEREEEIRRQAARDAEEMCIRDSSYRIKSPPGRIALRRIGIMPLKRPAAGGESRERDSFLLNRIRVSDKKRSAAVRNLIFCTI